ncbi:putative bifunctional UDP-N-acetylglucosamine transferase and deubiquitinase ALG13 [Rhipicephalus sanguineus]|uniref:putative bifunctional UDP-N-acetylglucosamine transferase and deubiquitinase ALG13 n=1 Tax=Rhipicephalus sanguineus TaxID=34632 RepID=UPI0020C23D2A|nr:putative bifunctional UDP-N-acetylglucosamine transferase and deubiquitinase ALG13 [Rhipicephalus sanguineus]
MPGLGQEEGTQKMDEYLNSLGFWRKQIAGDGSCLFRVVSEHVYNTQSKHEDVRKACVQHLRENKPVYAKYIDGDFEQYTSNMENVKVWGGHLEMHAMAELYKKDFLIFDTPGRSPYYATENHFKDVVMLCYMHGNHYDVIYSRQRLSAAAMCQSIVYETLYKTVFEFGDDVDLAVKKMLYDKTYFKHKKNMTFEQWKESVKFGTETNVLSEEEQATASDVVTALANRIPPFPFKVAKALDPTIYRNVEYDIWNEAEKERIRNEQLVIPELEPGVKCLVRLTRDLEGHSASFQAHIQKMEPDEGPITVFIEKLGKMCTVPYSSVQALPLPAHKVLTWRQGLQYKLRGSFYQSALLSSLQDFQKSQRRLARKGKGKDLSLWLPTLVTGARMPMDFSLPRPSDVSCTSPHSLRSNDIFTTDKVRFPLSPSLPMDNSQAIWSPPAPALPPGSPCQFPQPIMYQEKQRFESHTVFDFKPQICVPSSYSQSSAQDMPLKNDDSSVVSPGIQTQLPTAHHVETPYYGNFTTTVFDSSILSQPAHTEQGLLSTPPPSSYDYVSAPSFTYGAPSPDVLCSSPQNGVLSPGVTPHACATDATLPYGQEVVAVQQPLQQPQQHLVASYSPVPFTNLLFSCEPPAPTVNLAAQRSNDPEGSDLPTGKCGFFSRLSKKFLL